MNGEWWIAIVACVVGAGVAASQWRALQHSESYEALRVAMSGGFIALAGLVVSGAIALLRILFG